MIRNAVIHATNEQPLVADLFALPTAGDAGLLCTNVRTIDGKRPVFIDRSEATFFFPYLHIRFIEMPSVAPEAFATASSGGTQTAAEPIAPADAPEERPERGSLLPVPIAVAPDGAPAPDEGEIEIDEAFLRKIRDL